MGPKGNFASSLATTPKDSLLSKNNYHLDSTFTGQEMSSIYGSIRNSSSPSEFKPKKGQTFSKVQVISEKTGDLQMSSQTATATYPFSPNFFQTFGYIKQSKYDIWDLTYTLMTSKFHTGIGGLLLFLLTLIKYYTISCLIYMLIESGGRDTIWILVVVVSRVLFFVMVVKVSIETPETKTQNSMKVVWNSKNQRMCQYFEVIEPKKLFTTIIKGVTPAQFSFLYIKASPLRALSLYTGINFMSMSIEAVLYFPFFIYYTLSRTSDNNFSINVFYQNATAYIAIIAQILLLAISTLLIFKGLKRRKGKAVYH